MVQRKYTKYAEVINKDKPTPNKRNSRKGIDFISFADKRNQHRSSLRYAIHLSLISIAITQK